MDLRAVVCFFQVMLWSGAWLGAAAAPCFAEEAPPETATFEVGKDGRLLLVPVRFGEQTWMFCLDTGAAMTVFDVSLRSHLGEPLDEVTLKTSLGFNRTQQFGAPDAHVGRWSLQQLGSVACLDLEGIRRASGQPVDGILGTDFLRDFAVEIDFDAGRVQLSKSAPESRKTVESMALIQGPGRIFYVDAVLPTGRRELFSLNTGANHSTLRKGLFDSLVEQGKIIQAGRYRGVTVAGELQGSSGYMSHIGLGPFENEDIRVDRDTLSALGLRYLSRYKIRIDFPGKRLLLEPGARCHTAEPIATSGLSIVQIDGKKVVIAVESSGPAAAEDIQPGDIITHVQGQRASLIDLFSLGRVLTSAPGAKVSLRIQRGTDEHECRLTLRSRLQPVAAGESHRERPPAGID